MAFTLVFEAVFDRYRLNLTAWYQSYTILPSRLIWLLLTPLSSVLSLICMVFLRVWTDFLSIFIIPFGQKRKMCSSTMIIPPSQQIGVELTCSGFYCTKSKLQEVIRVVRMKILLSAYDYSKIRLGCSMKSWMWLSYFTKSCNLRRIIHQKRRFTVLQLNGSNANGLIHMIPTRRLCKPLECTASAWRTPLDSPHFNLFHPPHPTLMTRSSISDSQNVYAAITFRWNWRTSMDSL